MDYYTILAFFLPYCIFYLSMADCTSSIIFIVPVKEAIDYIHKNHSEPISLKSISNYLEINSSYFSSIFKKETSKTFIEILNEVRNVL